ncbi:MAG TPA: serine hydrolase domain-containing protein [Gaiellales bacterium]
MALQTISTWVDAGDASAVAAAVVGPGGIGEAQAAGAARADSLFALASLTKPLVALAVMVAAEEGTIDLDAPVAELLPGYRTEAKRAITPRHLLAHASGLPEVGPSGVAAIDVEPVCPPATRRIYSNEGYAVLGTLLSEATGIGHADYVRQAVFEPLGMDAYLGLPETEAGRALDVREPGLWRAGKPLFNSREWRARATAAGGAFATASAYARVVQLLLARGAPLIASETFAELAQVQFPGIGGGIESFMTWEVADWGLGCDIRDAKEPHWTGARTSPATLSHFGASGTLMWADPQAGVGLVCLANRGTYSGWMMRPGRWPDLSDAVIAEAA